MGNIKFLLLFFIVFSIQSIPQIKWLSPFPSPTTIYSVFFVDSLYGWVAGANSSILKTTDGGETWNEQYVPLNTTLRKIYFSSRDNGVIIGGEVYAPYFGSVLVTTDGGISWIDKDPIPYPSDMRGFNDIHFIDESVGYIAGFTGVYRTEDMGQTWSSKGGSGWATAIYFLDPQTGYLGNTVGGLLKTTNGGETWQEIASMKWTWHKDIKFINSQLGWLVSTGLYDYYGIIRKTTDGGLTWAIQDSQLHTSYNEIEVLDSLNAMVVGNGGRILYTTDGGNFWYSSGTNDDGDYFDITLQGTKKWISGGKNGYPRLMTSTESGFNWEMQSSELTYNNINGISFSDSLNGWFIGENGTLFHTIDGGKNWYPKNLYSISFISIGTPTTEDIYLGGNNGEFIKSTNNGTTWKVSYISNQVSEAKLQFFSKNYGYCFAPYQHELYKTTDAGESWSNNITTGYYLSNSFFADSANGWAVSLSGDQYSNQLIHTTDGGETWDVSYDLNYISALFFLDDKTGWRTNYETLLKTTNGGIDWQIVTHLTGFNIYQILFKDESEGYILTGSSEDIVGLFRTTDGGLNWEPLRRYTWLKNIYFKNEVLWGVGDYGQLIKFENILTSVNDPGYENYYPNSTTLFQNYPNPFNPSTVINYSVKEAGLVKLKVFDVLGREVEELVNVIKDAGNHSIEFNATNLPSGVYIYTLRINGYSSSKKMLLLK